MKNLIPLFLLGLALSACSSTARASTVEPVQAVYSTPTSDLSESITADPVLNSIQDTLSAGPHGLKYSCENCHASLQNGAGRSLIWFNEENGQIESVSTSTGLCAKCHPNQVAVSTQNARFAHVDFACTDCHNPHSTQSSCTQSSCHGDIQGIISAQVEKPVGHTGTGDPNSSYMCGGSACHDLAKRVAVEPIYHQPVHRAVGCHVCHDQTGSAVTQGADGAWTTSGGSGQPAVSHTMGRTVDCTKCHFPANPWGLVDPVSNPPIPTSAR